MVVKRRNDGGKGFRRRENGTADEVKWFGNKCVQKRAGEVVGVVGNGDVSGSK